LASGLHGRGLPLIIVSAAAGSISMWQLWTRDFSRARIGAVIAVAAIVMGWGVGQYDWILVDQVTITEGIGARSTQIGLVIVFGMAAVTAVPALIWLYLLVNSDRWSKDEAGATSGV
jgi:cytochrome d ubiquinol oxidase subunit II